MIQTALLGSTSNSVPKKVANKVDARSFALKLKDRVLNVKGRFAPDAASGMVVLTADAEAGADSLRDHRSDDDDDDDGDGDHRLVVVAEEPTFVIEEPKKVVTAGNALENIFGDKGESPLVGSLVRDPSLVWVSQLPAFANMDLWDPDVTIAHPAEQPPLEESVSSDIDRDIDEDEGAEEDERDDENQEEEEQEQEQDQQDDGDDDEPGLDDDVLLIGSSGGDDDNDDKDEQRIGLVLRDAMIRHSQTPKSAAKQMPHLLQPATATPKNLNFEKDELDLFELDEEEEDKEDKELVVAGAASQQQQQQQPPPSPFKPPATPSSPFKSPRAQTATAAVVDKTVPSSPQGPFSSALGKPVQRVLDPVERAKKQAQSSKGLDRFLVRGETAREKVMATLVAPAAVTTTTKPEVVASDNDDDDVDDDIMSAELSEEQDQDSSSKKKRSKLVDDEAEEAPEEEEEIDEENPFGLFDEDANFALDENDGDDDGRPSKKGRKVDPAEELANWTAKPFGNDGNDDDDDDEALFSAESSAGEEEDPDALMADAPPEDVVADENDEEEQERIKKIHRLRLEKDLAELNRIKDLYVLGQWKTEKLANRKQMGMEDYLDDEFQPAWNSIYNRDLIKHKLKKQEGGDAKDPQPQADPEQQEDAAVDEADVLLGSGSDSDGEAEYLKKREKLKQSLQRQRVASIFGGDEMSRGASILGGGELSRTATIALDRSGSSLFLGDGASNDVSFMGSHDESSRLLRLIDNRREASNAGAAGGGGGAAPSSAVSASASASKGGAFGQLLRNSAIMDNHAAPSGDPLKRLTLQRSNSKLVLQAQEKNLKRAKTHSVASTTPAVVVSGGPRQFFETQSKSAVIESEKRSSSELLESGGGNASSSSSRRKTAHPVRRNVTPTTPSKVKGSLLSRKGSMKK